jgi:lysophospholipase L1-like esterase
MGDSLTDPRSQGGKYLDVLRERCPKSSFTSFGKGGNMVNMMRKRFLRDVYGEGEEASAPKSAPAKYTHVLILGGLGDIGSNETAFRTAAKIEKDILEMVEMARTRGAQAIVLTIPPWKGHSWYNAERAQMARDVNEWVVSAAKAKQIDGWFDTRPSLSCGDPERLCEGLGWADNIHWSEKGHRAMGEALHTAMFSDCE